MMDTIAVLKDEIASLKNHILVLEGDRDADEIPEMVHYIGSGG